MIAARKECAESKKVPAEHIEKYQKFDFPDDEVTRCYIECVFTKFELFDATKGFNHDNLKVQLNPNNDDKIKADIDKCADKNEQKSDSCTWAYRGFKCFISKNLPLVKQSIKSA